jgi:hypothetical protein
MRVAGVVAVIVVVAGAFVGGYEWRDHRSNPATSTTTSTTTAQTLTCSPADLYVEYAATTTTSTSEIQSLQFINATAQPCTFESVADLSGTLDTGGTAQVFAATGGSSAPFTLASGHVAVVTMSEARTGGSSSPYFTGFAVELSGWSTPVTPLGQDLVYLGTDLQFSGPVLSGASCSVAGVKNLGIDSAVTSGVTAAYVGALESAHVITSVSQVTGITKNVYYAFDGSTNTYYATAYFSLTTTISCPDDYCFGASFSRTATGSWMFQSWPTDPAGFCDVPFPVDVVWGVWYDAADCAT